MAKQSPALKKKKEKDVSSFCWLQNACFSLAQVLLDTSFPTD